MDNKTVYTIAIVDSDGEISGEVGRVLVPSVELTQYTNKHLGQLKIGGCGINKSIPGHLVYYRLPNSMRFERLYVTHSPMDQTQATIDKTFVVWRRVE